MDSRFKTPIMKADTARICCAFAFVAAIVGLVLLFITEAPKPVPHIAASIIAIMALFVGRTQPV